MSGRFGALLTSAVKESFAKEEEDFSYPARRDSGASSGESISGIHARAEYAADVKLAVRLEREMAEADEKACAKLEAEDKSCASRFEREQSEADSRACAKQEDEDSALAQRLEREEQHGGESSRAAALERAAAQERALSQLSESKSQCDADEALASRLSDEVKREVESEAKDGEMAAKAQQRLDRESHRERKRREAEEEDGMSTALTVGERWTNALAGLQLEDVGGAVCLSVRLPDLVNVKVRPVEKRFIHITATRGAPLRDRAVATTSSANTTASTDEGPLTATLKLELVSRGASVRGDDVTYDYESCSSYLHIYVEHLQLARLSTLQRRTAISTMRKQLCASVSSKVRGAVNFVIDSHTK